MEQDKTVKKAGKKRKKSFRYECCDLEGGRGMSGLNVKSFNGYISLVPIVLICYKSDNGMLNLLHDLYKS
ncbi:hypothetical protein KCU71_g137, partial [Aureobasidium melanogenum]